MLRLAPRDFWAMTPRELAAAAHALPHALPPPDRATLDALMRRYPD
ncbi:MAG TPA: phage tail assembly chaperone [Hyphomicrobiales bacterium]|nr:phage tail assembly chaperone [Hyphomicrobiales bacterium]